MKRTFKCFILFLLTAFFHSGTAVPAVFLNRCIAAEDYQKKTRTNLEIFEDKISEGFQKILYYPGVDRSIEFTFVIGSTVNGNEKKDEQKRFMAGMIKKIASAEKLKISFLEDISGIRTDSLYNLVTVKIYDLSTGYPGFKKNAFLGEKTLVRNIRVKLGVEISASSSKFSLRESIESENTDEIPYDGYRTMENPQYSFTRAVPPDVGFFETIAFPVFLILVSATATVLFFVIRSK